MTRAQQEVLSILMMRFGLDPYRAIPITKKWLELNPGKNWHNLKEKLIRGEVTFKQGKLKNIKTTEIIELIDRMRDKNCGIEIKNRWYNLKLYRNSFVGAEAVKWLMQTEKISREEAIQLGQILIDRDIIHHVTDEHSFRDADLFYRFFQDEKAPLKDDITIKEVSPERGFDWGNILPTR